MTPAAALGDTVRRQSEVWLAVAVVFVVVLLVMPLPPPVLDVFLALSIGLAITVLLVALYTTRPLDFSVFPALLLLLTLFRLALNVSSTRLILGRGEAGRVIQSFGEFVIGGNYVVGLIIFLILVGINFIVITKGAGRVAEVAARFTLDAMPGKQMSIDADLSAGLIDEAEARQRRDEISRQADFYGAMDGASKFVKGDAVAGLLICAINIIGGILIGVGQRGLPLSRATTEYTILTVGDGLVTQIPALIVSTAAGIMVTHASGGRRMGTALAGQLGAHPNALWVAAAVLGGFAAVPGLPVLPFLLLAAVAAALARATQRREDHATAAAREAEAAAEPAGPADPLDDLLQVDPLEIEVGYALIPLIDDAHNGDLLGRISLLRRQAAVELGILVPPIRIRDDVRLPANTYVIRFRGTEVARAELMPKFLLALDTGGVIEPIEGLETRDPSFDMPARWISPNRRADAEAAGYVVVDPSTVVATHLLEMIKANAADLLGRQEVHEMVDALRRTHSALVEDVVPAKVNLGMLHRVLQRLLRERLPIRDLVTILEALGDAAETTKDSEALTEHVRKAMAAVIASQYADLAGEIRGITVGPRLEAALMSLFSGGGAQAVGRLLGPEALSGLLRDLSTLASTHVKDGRPVPVIAPPSLRVGIRRLIEPVLPTIPVISLAELPPNVALESVATWELKDEPAVAA